MMTLFAVSDMAFPPFHIDTRQILIYNNDETFVFSDVTIMPPRVLRVNSMWLLFVKRYKRGGNVPSWAIQNVIHL